MRTISFEQLPEAIVSLDEKITRIEHLLQNKVLLDQDSPTNDILSIREAAQLLHLSVPTVYSLVSRRTLPFNKRGKRLYFSRQELTDWIKSGRRETAEDLKATAERNFLHSSSNRKRRSR